jgi:hypothetical protein
MTTSPVLRVLAVSAVIYAIYLALALWLDPPGARPHGTMVIGLSQIRPAREGGFAYESPVPELKQFEEYSGHDHPLSPVLLYEDEKLLGPAHSDHDEIARHGRGHYSHWNNEGIIFSSSDNSDPTKNGRSYWAVLP